MPSDSLLDQARQWLAHDPDPTTCAELRALIDARSDDLAERFRGPLAFGTAGLRGIIGAGESRMNRAVVRRTTAGLARYVLDQVPDARRRGVVVGYDGRRQSDTFAQDAAAVLCAAGLPVHLSETLCPTPLVAFAVKQLGAAAGVMVTASHNPPEYNGYKVYAANGAQIIPPADRRIAAAIAASPLPDGIALTDLDEARQQGLLRPFGADLERRYLDAIAALAPRHGGERGLAIVYTALHGVGQRLMLEAFAQAGFSGIHPVAKQAEPDGAFPTVRFPNPEEKGALDLARELAGQVDAALIIANDPDADRLAAAVRTSPGGYQQLTGNEVGALLGHHCLTTSARPPEERLVVTTVVSSPQLCEIARGLGARCTTTLTGFKWIANRAMQLEQQSEGVFEFGFEEALGYTVGTVVRDKDGISAALVLAALAAELAADGKTLLDRLDELALSWGLYASSQRSLVLPGQDGAERIAAIMTKLRTTPPEHLADVAVQAVTDGLTSERRPRTGPAEPIDLPSSNLLIFELAGGHRVVARPSGTEPKLKVYVDVREPVQAPEELPAAQERATKLMKQLEAAMLAVADAP